MHMMFQAKGVNLACVRACVVVSEERPRIVLTTSFTKLFASLGLAPRAVSTSFGCRVNVGICLQVSDASWALMADFLSSPFKAGSVISPVGYREEIQKKENKKQKRVERQHSSFRMLGILR